MALFRFWNADTNNGQFNKKYLFKGNIWACFFNFKQTEYKSRS